MKTSPEGIAALVRVGSLVTDAQQLLVIVINETPDAKTSARVARIGELAAILGELVRDEYESQTGAQTDYRDEERVHLTAAGEAAARSTLPLIQVNPPADELPEVCPCGAVDDETGLACHRPTGHDFGHAATGSPDGYASGTHVSWPQVAAEVAPVPLASAGGASGASSQTSSGADSAGPAPVAELLLKDKPFRNLCEVRGCGKLRASGSAALCLAHLFAQTSDGSVSK